MNEINDFLVEYFDRDHDGRVSGWDFIHSICGLALCSFIAGCGILFITAGMPIYSQNEYFIIGKLFWLLIILYVLVKISLKVIRKLDDITLARRRHGK